MLNGVHVVHLLCSLCALMSAALSIRNHVRSSLSTIAHWTARVLSCICLRICVSTRLDCISSNASVLQDAETAYPSLSLGFNLVFIWAYGLSIGDCIIVFP